MTRSMSAGGQSAGGQRLAAGLDRHVGHGLVRPGVPAADDADPAADPLVAGVHLGREVVVGDHVARLVAAERDDPRARRGRERQKMSCACLLSGGTHPAPLELDADQRLALADRIPVLHQPLDDLRRPWRGDRVLAAAGPDRAEVGCARPAVCRRTGTCPRPARRSAATPAGGRARGSSGSARCSSIRSRAASSWSGVLRASWTTPGSARRARPVSVPAGGSSISAVTPRSAIVRMHRSQRTGAATWATMRSSHSWPVVTAAPSASDSSVMAGSVTATPAAAARSAATAGRHVPGVECPGHLQRPQPRAGRRVRREGLQVGQRPGRHDLPRPVDVGGRQAVPGDGREHRLLVAAEHRRHPGRLGRRRPPPWPGRAPRPAVLRHPRSARRRAPRRPAPRRCARRPRRSAGRLASHRRPGPLLCQRTRGGQRGRDQQRLRHRGVLDLVGARRWCPT